jgi:hypothetical protein
MLTMILDCWNGRLANSDIVLTLDKYHAPTVSCHLACRRKRRDSEVGPQHRGCSAKGHLTKSGLIH